MGEFCSPDSGTCGRCVAGCGHKPGWFLPGEAEKTAAFMGMTLPEFFSAFLAVDWWEAVPEAGLPEVFVLSPAVTQGVPGQEFPADPRGTCVFFQEGRCRIHPVKPHECRETWCGDPFAGPMAHHEAMTAWAGHQGQIRELLGRSPIPSQWPGE